MQTSSLATLKKHVLDILYPPQCLKCATLVSETGLLCSSCWQEISFIEGPGCQACGLPFEFDIGKAALCGACTREHPAFNRVRAALIYNDASRDLILGFKHGDRTHAANAYGKWLFRAGKELLDQTDIILPVPLHWSRLFHRRYNQAALLALELGKFASKPVETNNLQRSKRTASQGHKTPSQRRRNLQGAFAVPPHLKHKISDRRVLLIDDVLTTGATVSACAKTLRQAGARHIDVLTLARVVRTETTMTSQNDDADLMLNTKI